MFSDPLQNLKARQLRDLEVEQDQLRNGMQSAIGKWACAREVLDSRTAIVNRAKGGWEAGGLESMLHEKAIFFVIFDVENNRVIFRHFFGKLQAQTGLRQQEHERESRRK